MGGLLYPFYSVHQGVRFEFFIFLPKQFVEKIFIFQGYLYTSDGSSLMKNLNQKSHEAVHLEFCNNNESKNHFGPSYDEKVCTFDQINGFMKQMKQRLYFQPPGIVTRKKQLS